MLLDVDTTKKTKAETPAISIVIWSIFPVDKLNRCYVIIIIQFFLLFLLWSTVVMSSDRALSVAPSLYRKKKNHFLVAFDIMLIFSASYGYIFITFLWNVHGIRCFYFFRLPWCDLGFFLLTLRIWAVLFLCFDLHIDASRAMALFILEYFRVIYLGWVECNGSLSVNSWSRNATRRTLCAWAKEMEGQVYSSNRSR